MSRKQQFHGKIDPNVLFDKVAVQEEQWTDRHYGTIPYVFLTLYEAVKSLK